jgi:hypothetical protein
VDIFEVGIILKVNFKSEFFIHKWIYFKKGEEGVIRFLKKKKWRYFGY